MKPYDLVAPRDIFNRANFEFNIAKLIRAVQCNVIDNIDFNSVLYENIGLPVEVDVENCMYLDSGLFCIRSTQEPLLLKRGSNSRSRYSLYIELESYDTIDVFTSTGDISCEFIEYIGKSDASSTSSDSDSFTAAASKANFLKLIGKVALHSVNEVLENVCFDEDRYKKEDLLVKVEFGYYEIQKKIFTVDGADLCLSLHKSLTVGNHLVFWHEDKREYYKVFDEEGKFTDDFFIYVKQPKSSWLAIRS